MRIDILTLFPEMLVGPLDHSVIGRAREKELLTINFHNIREFAEDKHRVVDDYSFGSGEGMVLKVEPIFAALEHVLGDDPMLPHRAKVILTSPQGRVFDQKKAKELAQEEWLVIICGRYEGVDERIRAIVDDEISLGDYVLTGGELPTLVIVDAVVRLLPGVLGREDSPKRDSFFEGILDHPHYTRPREFRGMKVPEVLLSGDHERIRLWQRKEALKKTLKRRPELLESAKLSAEDEMILRQLRLEMENKEGK